MSSAGRNDLMPASDRNDLMPAQEKLEWVTPKISLMVAGETDGHGGKLQYHKETSPTFLHQTVHFGPS